MGYNDNFVVNYLNRNFSNELKRFQGFIGGFGLSFRSNGTFTIEVKFGEERWPKFRKLKSKRGRGLKGKEETRRFDESRRNR